MRFIETAISGAVVVEVEKVEDERGYFGRWYCTRDLSERGHDTRPALPR